MNRPFGYLMAYVLTAATCLGCGDSKGGKEGDSCLATNDCGGGLRCIDQVCRDAEDTMASSLRGGAGESCTSRRDCADGLSCLRQVCVVTGFDLEPTGKCVAVECESDGDCCEDFVPSALCDVYEQDCEDNPDDCLAFNTLCVCQSRCEDTLCSEGSAACNIDEDCTLYGAPVCVDGSCQQCREHGDCPDEGARCIDHLCQRGCENSAECPALHECKSGTCEMVGCRNDRQCVLLIRDPRATCLEDKSCSVPCDTDGECSTGDLEVCQDGACVFVGCSNDRDCRAYLDLDSSDTRRAVCLDPSE